MLTKVVPFPAVQKQDRDTKHGSSETTRSRDRAPTTDLASKNKSSGGTVPDINSDEASVGNRAGRKRSNSMRIGEIAGRAARLELQDIGQPTGGPDNVPSSPLATSNGSGDYRSKTAHTSAWLIPLDGAFMAVWHFVLQVAIVYVLFMTPLSISLNLEVGSSGQPWTAMGIIDLTVDVIFIADIVVNFHVTYINRDGVEVRDVGKLRRFYLKTWFVIDVLAALPFGLFQIVGYYASETIAEASTSTSIEFAAFAMLRFLKVARLVEVMRMTSKVIGFEVSKNFRRLARDIGILIGLLHFTACAYIAVAYYGGSTQSLHGSWVTAYLPDIVALEQSELNTELYICAFYWAVATLTTVGFGDVTPANRAERVVAIAVMLISAAYYGYLIASMASIVSSWDANAARMNEKMEKLTAYTKAKQFPRQLRRKIEGYYGKYYKTQHTVDEVEVLTGLSVALRREVTDFLLRDVKGEILSGLLIFKGLDRSVLGKLFLALTPHHFQKEEKILEFGAVERNLFILLAGEVEIACPHTPHRPVVSLKAGASFGEMQFLGLRQSTVLTLTAKQPCKVWTISRKDFHNTLDSTDDTLARIVSAAMTIYREYFELFLVDSDHVVSSRMSKYIAEVARFDVIEEAKFAELENAGLAVDPPAHVKSGRRLTDQFSDDSDDDGLAEASPEEQSQTADAKSEVLEHRDDASNQNSGSGASDDVQRSPSNANVTPERAFIRRRSMRRRSSKRLVESPLVRGRSSSFLEASFDVDRRATIPVVMPFRNHIHDDLSERDCSSQFSKTLSDFRLKFEAQVSSLNAVLDQLGAAPAAADLDTKQVAE